MARYESILGTIGRTPCVRLNRLAPPHVAVYVKIEAFNPLGSVKDRLALGIIEDAERRGALRPGQTVVEATSGNTGIGLAMVCARKGYPLVVTMAENFSIERRKILRFLGAKVVLTPAADKGSGMTAKAAELAAKHGWFLCRQFENEANPDIHSRTTALEILDDFADTGLDYWVTGVGTGGTLKGVARVLKEKTPTTRVVVCEPDNAPTLGSGIRQHRQPDGTPADSHPSFRPHLMQGWTPDFIPKLTEDALGAGLVDRIVSVHGTDALRVARDLATQEGIFCGISGGATVAGALAVAAETPEGAVLLAMLPDTGERYLSTPLFESIPVHMTEEERALSDSTPGYRFSGSENAAARPPAETQAASRNSGLSEAERFLDTVLGDASQPVVVFALAWCEFCWSVRKLFAKLEIPYRAVELDSVPFQVNDLGGQIRAALNTRYAVRTIPQVFVGRQRIGGATEVFDAYRAGTFQAALEAHCVPHSRERIDPYSFLPAWLQPR